MSQFYHCSDKFKQDTVNHSDHSWSLHFLQLPDNAQHKNAKAQKSELRCSRRFLSAEEIRLTVDCVRF